MRAKARDFVELCLTPSLAAELTLQPLRRYGMDGAILFSDILMLPYALGQNVGVSRRRRPGARRHMTVPGLPASISLALLRGSSRYSKQFDA